MSQPQRSPKQFRDFLKKQKHQRWLIVSPTLFEKSKEGEKGNKENTGVKEEYSDMIRD